MTQICECTSYPFPHRTGGGRCPASGWCPDCHTPLENRVIAWAKCEHGEHIEEAFCPKCGWSTE